MLRALGGDLDPHPRPLVWGGSAADAVRNLPVIESAVAVVAGVIDIAAEQARLEKALVVSRKEAGSLKGRLGNASFVERAKPEAVEKARADLAHHSAEVERLEAALARLG